MSHRSVFFLLWLAVVPVLYAGDDPSSIVSKMKKRYDNIDNAVIKFEQHVVFGVMKAEQSFSGTMDLKKGNRYRIEMEDQTIVTDGRTVWSYTKSNHQVLIDKFRDNPRSLSPDRLFSRVPDEYTTIVLGREKFQKQETIVLKMTPSEGASNIQWLKVWVDDDQYLMRKVQIFDRSENLTTYTVDHYTINAGMADDRFQFDPPRGTEIIDLR